MSPTPLSSVVELRSASRTHIGLRRPRNEDALLEAPAGGVFAVADGMGGAQGGELASRSLIEELRAAFAADGPAAIETLEGRVRAVCAATNAASRWIFTTAHSLGYTGMGTTLVSIVFGADPLRGAMVLHAGDSRAYCYREGALQQLTTDHSLTEELGLPEDCDVPAMLRGVVTRAVGIQPRTEMERTVVSVRRGDLFLLCSDGLTRMVPDEGIVELLPDAGAAEKVGATADALVKAALDAGGNDNISLVLLAVSE
jgi:serine/threonine protein phosphatase PrpC